MLSTRAIIAALQAGVMLFASWLGAAFVGYRLHHPPVQETFVQRALTDVHRYGPQVLRSSVAYTQVNSVTVNLTLRGAPRAACCGPAAVQLAVDYQRVNGAWKLVQIVPFSNG